MILTAREDIQAPIQQVYDRLTDVPSHERMAMRHAVKVNRTDPGSEVEAGAEWAMSMKMRGKKRHITLTLDEVTRPTQLVATTRSSGLDAFTNLDLVELSPGRTRLAIKVKLKPNSLPARLLIQSMKLTRASVERRFSKRFRDFAGYLATGPQA